MKMVFIKQKMGTSVKLRMFIVTKAFDDILEELH